MKQFRLINSEKFKGSDAKGLVSVQVLAALNIYLGGDFELSRETVTEFFYNLSMQALNRENGNILPNFERIANLVTSVISLLRQQNKKSIEIDDINKAEVGRQISDNYKFTFDLEKMEKIEQDIKKMIAKNEEPEIPEDFVPPYPLTEEEIKEQVKQEGEDLLQMQLTVNEDELRAADEVADEENKNVIKNIADPAPGLVVDNEIDFKDIDFLPETTDNTYKLTPKVQKHLDEMVLDSIQPKNEEDIYIDDELDSYVFQNEDETIDYQTKTEVEEDKIEIDALEDYVNILKSLNTTAIEISSDEEEEPMYITTTPSHPRNRLKRKRKSDVTGVVLKKDDVEFLMVNPSHPRDRLHRRVGGVKFMGITPSHPRDRLRRRVRKEDVKFLKKVPSHSRDRLRRRVGDGKVKFVKQTQSHRRDRLRRSVRDGVIVANFGIVHPRDRMKRILRNTPVNISADADVLKELPYFNAKIKVDELNKKKRRDAIMDKIIKQLPPNNDIYYVDHDRQTDTFRVRKDNKIKIESGDDDDVKFIKQSPTHPRDRLAQRSKQNNNNEVRKSKRLAKKTKR